jgi:hypothetical protein
MAGIDRIHGGVAADTLHGGYQQSFLLIAGTNVGTDDSVNGTTGAITDGNFAKAIRAIQTIATTVFIGPRANNGFCVAVDGATAQPTGPAYDADGTPTAAERIQAVVRAATGVSGATVTEKTLTLTDFA